MIAIKIVLLLVCYAYALWEGKREADFFYNLLRWRDISPKESKAIHIEWTVQRTLFFIPVFIFIPYVAGAGVLGFIFFHDGMYYRRRHQLNEKDYIQGWWDTATEKRAITDKIFSSVPARITLFAVGLMVFTFQFITL